VTFAKESTGRPATIFSSASAKTVLLIRLCVPPQFADALMNHHAIVYGKTTSIALRDVKVILGLSNVNTHCRLSDVRRPSPSLCYALPLSPRFPLICRGASSFDDPPRRRSRISCSAMGTSPTHCIYADTSLIPTMMTRCM
jgi:hypothetical protein